MTRNIVILIIALSACVPVCAGQIRSEDDKFFIRTGVFLPNDSTSRTQKDIGLSNSIGIWVHPEDDNPGLGTILAYHYHRTGGTWHDGTYTYDGDWRRSERVRAEEDYNLSIHNLSLSLTWSLPVSFTEFYFGGGADLYYARTDSRYLGTNDNWLGGAHYLLGFSIPVMENVSFNWDWRHSFTHRKPRDRRGFGELGGGSLTMGLIWHMQ